MEGEGRGEEREREEGHTSFEVSPNFLPLESETVEGSNQREAAKATTAKDEIL